MEGFKKDIADPIADRELLTNVARTSLRTKLQPEIADLMVEACVEAIQSIAVPDQPIDLHMVEILTMKHRLGGDSRFVRGLVLDHGTRCVCVWCVCMCVCVRARVCVWCVRACGLKLSLGGCT